MRHTNKITIKDIITLEKAKKKKMLSEHTVDTTTLTEIAQTSSLVNLGWRYKQVMSNADMDAAKKFGKTGVKKY